MQVSLDTVEESRTYLRIACFLFLERRKTVTSNLQAMIALLRNYPAYNPNEEEIKIDKLQALYEELKKLNSEANEATNGLITARMERNNLLYDNPLNMIELVTSIKNYLKSIEGANDYLKAVVKLKFKSK
jgi:hypothetical protein